MPRKDHTQSPATDPLVRAVAELLFANYCKQAQKLGINRYTSPDEPQGWQAFADEARNVIKLARQKMGWS